jgi:hypothetical protein
MITPIDDTREKRFQAAVAAMSAIITTNAVAMLNETLAKAAVSMADALLKELES